MHVVTGGISCFFLRISAAGQRPAGILRRIPETPVSLIQPYFFKRLLKPVQVFIAFFAINKIALREMAKNAAP